MPFKPDRVQPDFSSLVTSLDNSRVQNANYSLYQTILFLIKNVARSRDLIIDDIAALDEEASEIAAASFLTAEDESGTFANSRQLLAGTNITFDDTIAGQRTVNATGSSSGGMIPMATGAEPLEIMSNGAGEILLIGFDTDQPI